MYRFIHPRTIIGKSFNLLLITYLSFSLSGCASTRPEKPPTTVARALETRTYENGLTTVLKASINALQDMNYTIDVLNSDVGLITASRTTEQKQTALDQEKDESDLSGFQKFFLVMGVFVIVGILLSALSGGDNSSSDGWSRSKNDEKGPVIYRYKVTVNLNELSPTATQVRVSASGEAEQDGSILQTGGVHESEFFQKYFTNMNTALFLE